VRILVLNAGSSNLKASILDTPGRDAHLSEIIDWRQDAEPAERDRAVAAVLERATVAGFPVGSIEAVGHRVVHGGTRFTQPAVADTGLADAVDELSSLAPLHNPLAAATLRAALRQLPDVPHVAAFDTAFHASLPGSRWLGRRAGRGSCWIAPWTSWRSSSRTSAAAAP
jgi:acetate kinase